MNKNKHWIPSTKSIKSSTKIPIKYLKISSTITLQKVIDNVNNHDKNVLSKINNKGQNIDPIKNTK